MTTFKSNPVATGGAASTALYCNQTTQVKSAPGVISQVNVLVAGAEGMIYDCIGTANATTGTEVATVPATKGPVALNFPCQTGILYVPGSGQVASISYL